MDLAAAEVLSEDKAVVMVAEVGKAAGAVRVEQVGAVVVREGPVGRAAGRAVARVARAMQAVVEERAGAKAAPVASENRTAIL